MSNWASILTKAIENMGRRPAGMKVNLARWNKELICPPADMEILRDNVYSNCDHRLRAKIATRVRQGNCVSDHTALNFCGFIWKADGKFYEGVWVFNRHVETIEGRTLADVIAKTNAKYGSE